ncbi:MAG: hypothetical protein RL754_99 [Bacteroidota bacterium]|jgi:beta-lactam-binding protein with PASTA domain
MYGIFTTMKQWIQFIFSKVFVKTLAIGVFAVIVTGVVVLFWLNRTTNHGNYITVPDLELMSLTEAADALEAVGLSYEVIDSTHYVPKVPKGAIIEQFPAALAEVKLGRKIMLSTNPSRIPRFPLPTYKDQLVSYVRSKFLAKGFAIDSIVVVPDLSHDLVLNVFDSKGRVAIEQKSYEAGSRFVLHVSGGQNGRQTTLPDLVGLTFDKAEQALLTYSLSKGAVVFTGEIIDTPGAFIMRQSPEFELDRQLPAGSSVDLWLVSDSTLVPRREFDGDTTQF